MSTPPRFPSSPTAPHHAVPDCPAPSDLAPLFPHLEVLELVGRGGMGLVYKARQKSLDRLVALKVLPWQPGRTAEAGERFRREAKALARLQHPGIVAVHDSGQIGDWHYLVMEFVEGLNLRQAVERAWIAEACPDGQARPAVAGGRVSPAVVVTIVRDVCDALEYAHAQGVVHRDIKPENILLSSAGKFKVADFGLAKMMGPANQGRTLTAADQAMGTWHYAAPEQIASPQRVDHRADLYSLGVVMYELLTGERPVGQFPPPSARAGADCPLDAVVARALARDPAERFQHAADFRAALLAAWTAPRQGAAGQPGQLPDWAAKMLGEVLGGVVPAHVRANEVHVHYPAEAQAAPAPAEALVAHRHLPWPVILGSAGLFLAAWATAALLWNLGWAGLAVAGLLLVGTYVVVMRWALTRLPEMAEPLAGQDAPTRGLRWSAAGCLFLAGCGLLLFTPPLALDAQVAQLANEAYPVEYDLLGRWRGGEWVVPAEARGAFTDGLGALRAPGGKGELTRLVLSHRRAGPGSRGGILDEFPPLVVLLGGTAGGLALLCGAALVVPGARTFWTAGASLVAAVALPFAALGLAPALGHSARLGQPVGQADCAGGQDRVADELRDWARAQGYDLLEGSEWDLSLPETSTFQKLGLLSTYRARRPSALGRWLLLPCFIQRRSPDLLILTVANPRTNRVRVMVLPAGEGEEGPASDLLRHLQRRPTA